MKEKKLMIPIILGVILLCGIVFTVVYKKTSGTNPNNIQEEQTLAPKETQTIETRISIDESNKDLDDFNVNQQVGKTLDELVGENVLVVADAAKENNESISSIDETESKTLEGIQETFSTEEEESIMDQYLNWQVTYSQDYALDDLTPEEKESIAAETQGDISMYFLPEMLEE